MAPHAISDIEYAATVMHASELNRPATPNKAVPEDNELQAVWDEAMKGVGGVGEPHRKCAVLLISWEAKLDDLHTGDEVDALEGVFKDLFHYTVVKKQLVDSRLSPHLQVQKILLDFVVEYDDERTLLIVYYAGHGLPGKPEGEEEGSLGGIPLLLAGNRQPKTKTNPRNSVVWDEAEMIIKRTQGDVLVIFDCCHAGVLAKKTRSISDRNFEFLAACGSDGVTEMPGDNSFTSALIWALKVLVKSKSPFSTQQLLRKINKEAPKFPQHQLALIEERGEDETSCYRKLVLAPLPKQGEKVETTLPSEKEQPKPKIKHYLDLRFFYEQPPTKDEIQYLAQNLKDMIKRRKITARHIGWLKMTDIVKNAANQWKRRMTVRKMEAPIWAQKLAATGQVTRLDIDSPMTPPSSDSGYSSVENTPATSSVSNIETSAVGNVEISTVGNVENMTVSHLDTLTVNTSDISTARLRRLIMGGPDYRYRLKVFVVGLVVLLLECFHRLRPREAPAIVLLSFCGYAWWMSSLYHKTATAGDSTGISSYFPLLIGGMSLSICTKLLFADLGVTT